ncbi:prepilin signal peptidase PulO-like peptidase [Synechococcus sp. PCC 7502]|uniref:prepilin peptidase n=1 Tax=Synechococcus sp. PCC 7502 TaxID=1173263 RepID=UPI00029FD91A|nr:A24 family peptidase [Synechococcus sp. PCC 7502]AFY72750.1 prepilin signal peptidase PulO-like peptidase [Synechococcus sp. PCC 7502]
MLESLIFQALAIIFGASIGSFLNVVIYRLPAGISILYPPSRCPSCFNRLKPIDNIPIIGWFLIKGKCRYCHQKVAWRYPLIEFLTALIFWLVTVNFITKPPLVIVGYCLFVSCLIALAVIDIDTMTLPNPLTQLGLFSGICFHICIGISSGKSLLDQLIFSVLGAVVGIWLVDAVRFLGTWLLQREAMGAGDAKLAAMIGAWLGWQQVLLTLFLAAVIGSLVGVFILRLINLAKTQPFAFGPFLAIAATFSLVYGEQFLRSYLNWFGLA